MSFDSILLVVAFVIDAVALWESKGKNLVAWSLLVVLIILSGVLHGAV